MTRRVLAALEAAAEERLPPEVEVTVIGRLGGSFVSEGHSTRAKKDDAWEAALVEGGALSTTTP